MNTRTFTAAAFAVALSTSLALAQEQPGTTGATRTEPATQPGMSATQPGAPGTQAGMTTAQPGAAGMAAQQPGATFTDARSFVLQELQEQKHLNDIYQMAQDKAQSEAIKKLAKKELQEHKQAGEKLKEVAKEMNIEEQAGMTAPRAQQLRQLKERLQTASGKEFDRTFLNELAGMHQMDISRFQAAVAQAREEQVKQWAQETLPKLQEHFQETRRVYQEETGTAWTPGQQTFMPAARYETQPAQPGATTPDTSGKSLPGTSGQSSPGMSGQPSSPMSDQGTER